jgi:hypothetical protein
MLEGFFKKFDYQLKKLVAGDDDVHQYIYRMEEKWRWWNKHEEHKLYRITKPFRFNPTRIKSKKLDIKAAAAEVTRATAWMLNVARRKQEIYYPVFIFESPAKWKQWPLAQKIDQTSKGKLFIYENMPYFEQKVEQKYVKDILGEVIIDGIVEVLARRIK